MSNLSFVNRHLLIYTRLQHGGASFAELKAYLENNSDEPLAFSLQTWDRDRKTMLSVYQIEIVYNRAQQKYIITNPQGTEIKTRLLDALNIAKILSIANLSEQYIDLEKRRPMGLENFNSILNAIKNHKEIVFDYHDFLKNITQQRTVRPYMLKEYKNRWYVLAQDVFGELSLIKSFALDRITHFKESSKSFPISENIDVRELFRHSFGIYKKDTEPEKVLLSFTPYQAKYIKSLPLHHSQHIVKENDSECIVELRIHITYDFLIELRSIGANVKVLEPKHLQDELVAEYKKALEQYSE